MIEQEQLFELIPRRFDAAVRAIQRLAVHYRYQGAFIFGSVARGDSTGLSDLDVKVVVDGDNPCSNINHPFIGDVKLDLTFISLAQLETTTQGEIERAERAPMLAESLIVFDKTGQLAALRQRAQQARPKPFTTADHQLIQFLIYHMNDKVARFLESDPHTALLSLHMNVNELLDFHYWIRGHWRVSSKRLLQDLEAWDSTLAEHLRQFVTMAELDAKFAIWTAMIEHVLQPLGGRQPIHENNCGCDVCRGDLDLLQMEP